ncbi:MAG: CDP-diacylglycerol--serine O-phosphatidyltransferase [Bacteroidota bacterium]|nr:CDP-diacylglycerol--serine O-phosphatidyltransferase [Bacteroidota bacterium]
MENNSKPIASHIPNLITSLNLFMGCMSIVFAFQDRLVAASVLIFIAGIFDFFDGFTARLLNAYSEIGKSLDSLADMVSFGVAPSAILFQLLTQAIQTNHPALNTNSWTQLLIPATAFIVAVFSALRLAKFNIDERQTSSFIGVPTPANAFLIASLPFIIYNNDKMEFLLNIYILIPTAIVLSLLLVAELPMISLKFKNFSFRDNKSKFILLIGSVVLLAIFQIAAFPLIFVMYLIISVIDNPQKAH